MKTRNLFLSLLLFVSFSGSVIAQKFNNPIVSEDVVFEEKNGIVAVEAEYFYKQSKNDIRQWYRTSKNEQVNVGRDEDGSHWKDAGNNTYLEILPDTRVTSSDKLVAGENFSNQAGEMAILHYRIKINNPGRYYVWARAYSAGAEDNSIHVGFNGDWPESGQRLQWCEGKNGWRWESKQRTEKVHCGEPYLIYLDIEKAGVHEITFSMREDGFEFDRFLLTNSKEYIPQGIGPEIRLASGTLPEPYAIPKKVKASLELTGELKQWHKVTLALNGPETSEWAKENPFLDYKLEVTFSKGNKSYLVPGYFAADGNAAETSADQGNIWKVHFRPDEVGLWNYKVSFRKGKNIVVIDEEKSGDPLELDGKEGAFKVAASDKTGSDFRASGRIINGGRGYFKFQGTDKIWIKNGADSPENFLAFADFDQTSRFTLKKVIREGEANPDDGLHKYDPHISDWKEGNPTWQNGKGKGMIGALNYLHSVGVNSVYMLTMNIIGDGKDVWPYNDYNERYRFDCSKLDQWEVVFEYMEQLGIMNHFVLQETENECLLDMGYTGVQRKVYLRELVARFGHHLAVTWNLGEENGPAEWTPIGQTDEQKKAMANYIKEVNPYPCNVVLHTHADDGHQDKYLNPMLGFKNLDGPSLQIGNPLRVHERVKKWVEESEKAGDRWIVNLDEIGPAWKGAMPDSHDANHDTIRHNCLWGTLLAGGTGVEWYFGYRYPHNDLGLEDFRSRDAWFKQSTTATQFVKQFPLEEMKCMDELVNVKGAYCLAKQKQVYVVYLPAGTSNAKLRIIEDKTYSVKWFNPRKGGELLEGNISSFSGSGLKSLGNPPSETDKDWVVILQ